MKPYFEPRTPSPSSKTQRRDDIYTNCNSRGNVGSSPQCSTFQENHDEELELTGNPNNSFFRSVHAKTGDALEDLINTRVTVTYITFVICLLTKCSLDSSYSFGCKQ